jgi:hypothetical protein
MDKCELCPLMVELKKAQKLLETPPKRVWQRLWGLGAKAALMALMALLLLLGVSHALTDQQKALVGLKGVYVYVEEMDPQAERLGLTKDQIKTDVELRLRKAGVRVLTEKEGLEPPGIPHLYVRLSITFRQSGSRVNFLAKVALKEWVTLARGFETFGAIWEKICYGSKETRDIREIRKDVDDLIDYFINDYLAANPK